MNPLAMSGLELVQAMIEGRFPHPSMAETIPMRATEAGRGYVKFRVRADAGVGYGTVDLDVKLLKAVPLDHELIAEGRIIHVSKTLGVAEGSIRDADGALLAHATCACAILRKQAV